MVPLFNFVCIYIPLDEPRGMQWGLNLHCGMVVLLVFHTGIGEGFSPPEIYI